MFGLFVLLNLKSFIKDNITITVLQVGQALADHEDVIAFLFVPT
jgi:hypothetical protein